ncbi:MAG: hypothetical protein J6X57_03835 [Bacteroidales bacterium]|nr:hypothetical protein [Bacteroidales bacterium]
MKTIVHFFVAFILVACSLPFDAMVVRSFENRSSIKPMVGILDFDYADRLVHANALVDKDDKRIRFSLGSERAWKNKLKDSVLVVFIDPSVLSIDSSYLISQEDANRINITPSCVLVKYILSRQQFEDPSYYCRIFPPNNEMKDVNMIPSFQEVVARFSE